MLAPLILLAYAGPTLKYRDPNFESFVAESFQVAGAGSKKDFVDYMDRHFKEVAGTDVGGWIRKAKARKAESNLEMIEIEIAADLHRIVKKAIPKFDLDRGFEFSNTAKLGERQCFLQSVIIASLLQSAGLKSGVVMVWRNEKDQPSNNGHATSVLFLKNGALQVDASEPHSFAKHQGIFLRDAKGKYRFTRPVFAGTQMKTFRVEGGGTMNASSATGMEIAYIRSMFDFYRGERAPGGLLAKTRTSEGLAASAKYLERAVTRNPENGLARFQWSRVLKMQGDAAKSADQFAKATATYRSQGWLPPSLTPKQP